MPGSYYFGEYLNRARGKGRQRVGSGFYLYSFIFSTARYNLKYCLKQPLYPKQPTNQLIESVTLSNADLKVLRCIKYNTATLKTIENMLT